LSPYLESNQKFGSERSVAV